MQIKPISFRACPDSSGRGVGGEVELDYQLLYDVFRTTVIRRFDNLKYSSLRCRPFNRYQSWNYPGILSDLHSCIRGKKRGCSFMKDKSSNIKESLLVDGD